MSYKHGIYGERISSKETIFNSKNVPVYVGVAPVHRVNGAVNKPILIKSVDEAIEKLGYKSDDDFSKFSLSAAVFGHFENGIKPVGPIVVINVLNPEGISASGTVDIINGIGIIKEDVVNGSLTVDGKVKDIDYKTEYTEEGYLKVIGITLTNGIENITYSKIDVSAITETEIVGTYNADTGIRTGIQAIDDVYEELNLIPSIISAPGYNHKPKVEQALVTKTSKISDRWEVICFTDIDPDAADTLNKAFEWKKTNKYNSFAEKTCWPKGVIGNKEVWMSVCAIVAKLQTDIGNNDIPYETPSNKPIDITGMVANKKSIKLSLKTANELNEKGITTALFSGGKYVLWGPHMANYEYGVTNKLEEIFDVNIMMSKYLLNDFHARNMGIIDSPMTRNDIDALINSEQMILNSLVSDGKILYGEIKFIPTENPKTDVLSGDFKFDTLVTNTPPSKSITNRVQYTSLGINTLYGEGEE